MEHRLGAEEDPGRAGVLAGTRRGRDLVHRLADERGELLGGAGGAEPQALQARRTAGRAHERPPRTTDRADELPVGTRLDEHRLAALAAHDRAARTAGEQPRPAGPVEHADDGDLGTHKTRDSRTIAAQDAELKRPDRGSSPRRSITSRVAQPSRSVSGAIVTSVDVARPTSVGQGLTKRHRHSGAARPLGGEDGRVPSRGALFHIRLGVGVEDDDDAEPANRCEHRRPRPDDGAAARGRLGPRLGLRTRPRRSSAVSRRASTSASRRAGTRTRVSRASTRSSAAVTTSSRGAAGGRRSSDDGIDERPARRHGDLGAPRHPRAAAAAGGAAGSDPHDPRRRTGEQERAQPAGVSPGAETPELDELGDGPSDTTPRISRSS